ncbi:MAG: response regulator RpfG family c-di-GMP phosphodiesterase [Candidatus Azotimanducaceae bacterium]|jgi:response regulator RpfG family c-di-GMP phosphodiesterase
MSAATAQQTDESKPALLFIDDEPRVLKSMRAMFRRDYEVYLANSGQEALEIMANSPIQVVVSDQRMPHMTGVEVLSTIKSQYPNVVRILLTGYADLEAIEASLNEAEVFRYLMKPCPADEVKSAVQAGLATPNTAKVIPLRRVTDAVERNTPTKIAPAQKQASLAPLAAGAPIANKQSAAVGDIVLLGNTELAADLTEIIGKKNLHLIDELAEVTHLKSQRKISILIADVEVNQVAALTSEIQRVLPNVVTLVASDRSDASLLIKLINSGDVFRFLLKPAQIGRLRVTLNSSFERYQQLAPTESDTAIRTTPWQRFISWLVG